MSMPTLGKPRKMVAERAIGEFPLENPSLQKETNPQLPTDENIPISSCRILLQRKIVLRLLLRS